MMDKKVDNNQTDKKILLDVVSIIEDGHRQIHERLTAIECMLSNTIKNMDRLHDDFSKTIPKIHEKISKNSISIEKTKLSAIMESVSISMSFASILGVIIVIITYIQK